MIQDEKIKRNVELYIQKMQEKMREDNRKIEELKTRINHSAVIIQRKFRSYRNKKRNKAALVIQHFWKVIVQRVRNQRRKLLRFKVMFNSYKILYFLRACKNKRVKEEKTQNRRPNKTRQMYLPLIKANGHKLMILLSSLHSQIAYLRKYSVYDKKLFAEQWQAYESKKKQWIWGQIKKKWIKKEGAIWINDNQKEVNAQKYIQNIIQQSYTRQHARHQKSQEKIKMNEEQLMNKMKGVKKYFYSTLML